MTHKGGNSSKNIWIYQKLKLVDKNINIVSITIYHTSKKVEERLGMVSRDMENVKKKKKQTWNMKNSKSEINTG